MGLLTKLNETSLRSLRYGKDRIGGGSSNQPYITKSIPDNDSSLGNTGGIDFLLRGGTLAVTSTADDVSRLTKMFFDTKSFNGQGFILKQNLLSLSGVRTQASNFPNGLIAGYSILNDGVYLPTSTLAQAGGNAFGVHFNKQGLLGGIESFIGLGQGYSANKNSITSTNSNRLIGLYDSKILGNILPFSFTTGGNSIATDPNYILSYVGGPNSVLGVGRTRIKFADQRITRGIGDEFYNYKTSTFSTLPYYLINNIAKTNETKGLTTPFSPKIVDFRKNLQAQISSIISKSPDYSGKAAIEQRVFLNDPGKRGNISSYVIGKRDFTGRVLGALDKITAKPLYLSSLVDDKEVNDLVKFRIEAINNNNPGESVFIHFRAFLDSFSDVYNATWNPTKYIGRGEDFYTYGGFTRGISINWTVAAQSKEELIPMHQKLNYLASNLTPDYSDNGYMRGPMMKLTVGGYLYSQPGFITNLTYTIDENSPWEIGINDTNAENDNSVKELPHVIKVNMNYTPIHEFVPRKQKNNYDGPPAGSDEKGKYISSFGSERYIALSTGNNNNYDDQRYLPQLRDFVRFSPPSEPSQEDLNSNIDPELLIPTIPRPTPLTSQAPPTQNQTTTFTNNSNTFRGF